MARFDLLPPEVYRTVIEHLEPDDVISFSFVCRKLYLLSKDRIVRHVELQDIYSEIRIDQDHHPLTLLYAIRKNPEIAFYIKHVEWHGVDDPLKVLPAGPLTVGHQKETIPVGPWLPDDIRTFMPDLRAGLHHSGPYVIAWSQFRQQLSEGNVNACFLLLLFHLPRLVRLRFSCPTFDSHFWHRMLSAWNDTFDPVLVEKNPLLENGRNPAADSPYPHRLSPPTLQIVEALDDETGPNRLTFSPLTAFTALSSVRALRLKDATQTYRPYSLAWQTEPTVWSTFRGGVEDISDCGSDIGDEDEDAPLDKEPVEPTTTQLTTPFNIRNIEITDSDIAAESLAELLPNCPRLTSFKMSYAAFDGIHPRRWHDLPCLFNSLETNFASTLTHLSLVHPFDYGATPQVTSFASFTALKWLEISLATLLPQEMWREKEAWRTRPAGKVPRLLDILPESLEELVIGTEISPQALSKDRLLSGWPLVTSSLQGKRPLPTSPDDPASSFTKLMGSRSAFAYFQPSTDGKSTTDSRSGSAIIESGYSWREDLATQAARLGVEDGIKRKSMAGEWEREWARQRGDSPPKHSRPSRRGSLESIDWQPYSMSPPAAKRPRIDTQEPALVPGRSRANNGIDRESPAMAAALSFLFPAACPPIGADPARIVNDTYPSLLGQQGVHSPARSEREKSQEHDPSYQPLPAMSRLSIENDAAPADMHRAPLQPLYAEAASSQLRKQLPRLTPPSSAASSPGPERPAGLRHQLKSIQYFCCSTIVVQCDCLDAASRRAIDENMFVGLDIRRRISEGGWTPDHEEHWDIRGSCCGSSTGGWSEEDAEASRSGSEMLT